MEPAGLAFKNLKLLDLRSPEARKARIPLGPTGLEHGVLENGLTYYVRKNAKPNQRAALALSVKIGSVVETEEERGVAHLVEHLAFNATKRYSNHEIVKFLESIGAEFGACQNAYTSADETVFELLVPIDKPGLLSQAISVLAEFSTEVRVAPEDVEKERGAVIEEWRERRNAQGRMQEAYWAKLMEGSQYAERQPIGLEKVIRGVSASVVKDFYNRWYRLENMALVAIGDFEDSQSVVDLIKEHFLEKRPQRSAEPPTPIPVFPLVPHTEPRYSIFAEREAGGSAVMVSCKLPMTEMISVEDYRASLAEEMFHLALNQRLFKICRRPNPPFFSATSGHDNLVRPVKAYMLLAACRDRGTIQALETILTEVARVRQHGFSEREISLVRALYLSNTESLYLERDQMQSTSLRDEYMQHFLRAEPVPGIEYEAQLAKTLLPEITAEEVRAMAEGYRVESSCVVKTVEPRVRASLDDIRAAVQHVQELEASGNLPPWDQEDVPDEIVEKKPEPGEIASRTDYPKLGATEIVLSNGLRVCYKCTPFLDDQVLINGYAYGGLSEVKESDFRSCGMGATLASEMGTYGHKPAVLMDMLAGKRADVGMKVAAYMRQFSADCSPADLETGLQLLYQLFVHRVEAVEADLRSVMQMAHEAVRAQLRDPHSSFSDRVRSLNYGNSYYFRPMTTKELRQVDPRLACAYFDSCFRDPAPFTAAMVGNVDPEKAIPLLQQYLGGIPRPPEPIQHFQRDHLTAIPFTFPKGVIREEVHRTMVEAQGSVQITFPLDIGGANVLEEVHWTGFICKLLETKLLQVLRFKHGQVYTASVSPFLGGSRPSRQGSVRGDIAVSFSCDPSVSWKLVDLAVEEVERLQQEGPSEADCRTVLELEQRAHETGLQENGVWLDKILRAYQSRAYNGNLEESFNIQEETREAVTAALTSVTMKDALQRILPLPASSQYTAVVLMPRGTFWRRLLSLPPKTKAGLTLESKILLAGVTAGACALLAWRLLRQSR